jgi:hypothetical protein
MIYEMPSRDMDVGPEMAQEGMEPMQQPMQQGMQPPMQQPMPPQQMGMPQ